MAGAYEDQKKQKFAIFWMTDNEVKYKIVLGNKSQAQQVYNNIDVEDYDNGAKIFVNGQYERYMQDRNQIENQKKGKQKITYTPNKTME